jgi:pimeloyl-ACP methyl ester carboxylesterase
VASAADYVSCVADALGIDRFAVVDHSGGGPHALACGALLPERVIGVVSVAGMAPFGAEGLARRCPWAQLWLSTHEGHISVLHCGAASMEWLREHAEEG